MANDFDLNLYKPFLVVYETLNLTRAAEKLHITPPAVGMRIKELQRQLGDVTLFTSHRRGVHPTKEADSLYNNIRTAMSTLFHASDSICELKSNSVGILRIGAQASVVLYHVADFLSNFIINYPKIKLEIHHLGKTELKHKLHLRELDIVITTLPFTVNDDLYHTNQLTYVTKSFYASEHYIEKNNIPDEIKLDDLKNYQLLLPSRERDDTRLLLQSLGCDYNSFLEVSGSNEFIYAMVKRNAGIGYISSSTINPVSKLKAITVHGVDLPKFNLSCVYHKNEPSSLILSFAKHLNEHFKTDDKIN